jgi:hypothetical protein
MRSWLGLWKVKAHRVEGSIMTLAMCHRASDKKVGCVGAGPGRHGVVVAVAERAAWSLLVLD